ncbi:MAG: helix-turn-helix domain-containing protein [Verrucomicrobiota bacterium]
MRHDKGTLEDKIGYDERPVSKHPLLPKLIKIKRLRCGYMKRVKPNPIESAAAVTPKTSGSSEPSALKPEWLRIPDAIRVSGLSRSTLYVLIGAGKIKSFSNRARGSQRGIRLISYDSLIDYLERAYLASVTQLADAAL